MNHNIANLVTGEIFLYLYVYSIFLLKLKDDRGLIMVGNPFFILFMLSAYKFYNYISYSLKFGTL
jgi:hypothetical protein